MSITGTPRNKRHYDNRSAILYWECVWCKAKLLDKHFIQLSEEAICSCKDLVLQNYRPIIKNTTPQIESAFNESFEKRCKSSWRAGAEIVKEKLKKKHKKEFKRINNTFDEVSFDQTVFCLNNRQSDRIRCTKCRSLILKDKEFIFFNSEVYCPRCPLPK